MHIVSIDIETTGTDPSWCQTIEVGAVIWDTTDFATPVSQLPAFHCYVKHPQIRGQAYALALNARILERIAKQEAGYDYLAPSEVGPKLARFINGCLGAGAAGSVSPTGFNFDGFDRQFLGRLPRFAQFVTLTHRSLAPATLFFEPMTDAKLINSDETFRRAGVTVAPGDRHTALGDARAVIEVLRAAYNPPRGDDSPAPPDGPRCPECGDRKVIWVPEGRGEAEVETVLQPCSTCQPVFAPVSN